MIVEKVHENYANFEHEIYEDIKVSKIERKNSDGKYQR